MAGFTQRHDGGFQQHPQQHRSNAEAEQQQLKIQNEMQLSAVRQQQDHERYAAELQFKWDVAQLEAATKIQVARMNGKGNLEDPATQAATNEIVAEVRQ